MVKATLGPQQLCSLCGDLLQSMQSISWGLQVHMFLLVKDQQQGLLLDLIDHIAGLQSDL